MNVASGDSLNPAAEFRTRAAPNDETAIYLSAALHAVLVILTVALVVWAQRQWRLDGRTKVINTDRRELHIPSRRAIGMGLLSGRQPR